MKLVNILEKKGKFSEIIKKYPNHFKEESDFNIFRDMKVLQRETQNAAAYDITLPYKEVFKAKSEIAVFFGWYYTGEKDLSEALLLPRSSLFKKKGLLIRRGYNIIKPQGFVEALFYNPSDKDIEIEAGERLAQILITDFASGRNKLFPTSNIKEVKDGHNNFIIPDEYRNVFNFLSKEDVKIMPGTMHLCMSDLKWKINPDEVILLTRETFDDTFLANGIGVVDADYFENEGNDGNIGFLIYNHSYMPKYIKVGDFLGEGVVKKYSILEDDIPSDKVREGGFGSTGGK